MDFAHYWQYTDMVGKTLFFILIALSLVSWFVGTTRLLSSRQMTGVIGDKLTAEIDNVSRDFGELDFNQRKIITEQIARCRFELEKGLSVLGTTVAIAPFIGLFGMVWGISCLAFYRSEQAGRTCPSGRVCGRSLDYDGSGFGGGDSCGGVFLISSHVSISRAIHHANDTAHVLFAHVAR